MTKDLYILYCSSKEKVLKCHKMILTFANVAFKSSMQSQQIDSGVFRILILRVPSVNRIFPLRVLTAGAISLFLNITGAIAPMAPVLNTPLQNGHSKLGTTRKIKEKAILGFQLPFVSTNSKQARVQQRNIPFKGIQARRNIQ